jgi:Protein kinase domain
MPIQPAPNLVIAERFRLNRMIGRGGMGSVWYATHLGLDVPCAVKFIEGEGAELPEVQARFEREAKAAAQLRSPHVVQILDHGVWQGTPYIAMELLDGEDLGKRLGRLGRLPPQELLRVITQVCRALSKAHAQGIVHRDLKPDNIFLVRDDDREIAKVLDFGIAKAASSGAPGANTRTGAMLGTPYYMSPEQAQGTRAVDARSDLWSLGVIVFESLTGRRPFESEALGDLLMKIIVGPIPLPSQVVRDLPPAFDGWWARASQRDPAQRYRSAKELSDSLALVFGRSGSDVGEPVMPLSAMPSSTVLAPAYLQTPQPQMAASTGAPIAQTFAAADGRSGLKGRAGMIAAVGGALVVLSAAAVGVSFAVRGKGDAVGRTAAEATASSPAALGDAMVAEPPTGASAPLAKLRPETAAAPVLSASPLASVPAPAPAAAAAPASATISVSARPFAVGKPTTVVKPPPATSPGPVVKPAGGAKPPEEKKPIDLGIYSFEVARWTDTRAPRPWSERRSPWPTTFCGRRTS